MKFTLSWLKEHLDTDATVDQIADKLNSIGLEVESISDPGAALKDFIVGEVITAGKHPNADKLRLCTVSTGTEELQIVCGAPNARDGIKVVLARPGTVIPATGEALKIGSIRGVESRGMMCSARELLLGEDHDGIIELKADAKVGAPVAAALEDMGLLSNDPVIDVAITPNRGDAASVWGVARDLAAAGLGKLRNEKVTPVAGKFPSPKSITLEFSPENKNACPVFAGRLIRGVRNGPAPKWVQERFKAVGMKSISALVDVTNFVSQDRGRPLHVFDADKIGNLKARMAKDGEQVLALDDATYTLDGNTIVIADEARALGIAGVMGGKESGSYDDTVNVFIESAYFDPGHIARAGRKQGIISDARYRFERGVDPQFVLPGLEMATRLILEWCGGEASDVVIAGALPPPHAPIAFDPAFVEKLGGIQVPRDQIIRILRALGFVVEDHVSEVGGTLQVVPPSWRHDVDGPADLVEEVVRIYGLTSVASVPLPRAAGVAKPVLTRAQRRAKAARRAIASRGFNEAVSFSFISREHAALFGGGDDARQLSNPIASDLDALRPTPLSSLLAAAGRNAARGLSSLQLFELGPAFQTGMPEAQQTIAAGLRTGNATRDWSKTTHDADVFDVKADMLAALEAITGAPMAAPISRGAPGWYHPGRSGVIALGKNVIARFGELHPKVLAAFDLKVPAAAFEIILEALPDAKTKGKARPLFAPSPYQATERDFAFVVKRDVAAGDIVKAVKLAERNLIDHVAIFDVYEGKGVAEGMKSVAVTVRIQPKDKTLMDAEIEAIAAAIVAQVTKATGATLRA